MRTGCKEMQDTCGGTCLVGAREAVSRLGGARGGELEIELDRPRRLGVPGARSSTPPGTIAGQHNRSTVWLTPGSISVAVDRWRRKRL